MLPALERVELPLVAQGRVDVALRIVFPEGLRAPLEVWFLCKGGHPIREHLRAGNVDRDEPPHFKLPNGLLDVVAHTCVFGEGNARKPSLQYSGSFQVAGGEVLEIPLTEGAVLEGIALDRDGLPIADEAVVLTPSKVGHAIYRTTTDSSGAFRFVGLVPGQYYAYNNGERVWVGAPWTVYTSTVVTPGDFP
jgi:hypothetical protein